MRLYHRTTKGQQIIKVGFRDGVGCYLTSEKHRGVWLANLPLDSNEGAKSDDLLAIDIPIARIRKYEWGEDGKPYREFLVPARIVNDYGPVKWVTSKEADRALARFRRSA